MASFYKGPVLSREQLAQVAYQGGFRGDLLGQMVAIAHDRESALKEDDVSIGASSGAHRTDTGRDDAVSGDFGLWQINWSAWGQQLLEAGIIGHATDLYDPVTNARAAMFVYQRQGLDAWAMATSGRSTYQSGGDPFRGVDVRAGTAAVARAANMGMLGQDWNSGQTAAGQPGPATLPRDARVISTPNGTFAVFPIGAGVWVRYSAGQTPGIRGRESMTMAELNRRFNNPVDGGQVAELEEIPVAFGTYQAFTNAILDQMFAKGDPRRSDPEIMRVLATRAGRPDMTEAEFENLLKGTQYYQKRTETQLRWNDLSQAEQQLQIRDTAARMAQTYQAHVGSTVDVSNEWIRHHAERVASGEVGFGQWTETNLKPLARQSPESPWSRQLREEAEAQRDRPIDIENTALRIRDTLTQWGLKWAESTIANWARNVVQKNRSDEDLLNTIKQQAQVLYPWKDPEMETVVAAGPWIETYNRVLERQGSLQTPEIARALSAYGRDPDNNDPWSFEQQLKMSDAYDQTRQGRDEAFSTTAELAGMMGF